MSDSRTQRRRVGFTLLELLMVVVIIAILASIALPQYLRASEKARATEALTALGALRASELRYRALSQNGIYTNNLTQLDVEFANSNNPNGILTSWDTLTFNIAGGNNVASGAATYSRASGEFNNQIVGIQFGSGRICGNFEPLGLTNAACASD